MNDKMHVALVAILTAFTLDLFLGDPPNRFHPVVAMGSFIRWFTRNWNKGNPRQRFLSGSGLILVGGGLFSIPWLVADLAWQGHPYWVDGILLGVLLKPMIAFRGLLKASWEVQQALMENNLDKARLLVSWHLVSRDTSALSGRQVGSATIESLAENLTDSFLAPLFYFALGGLPLAWFYRFVNTADAMIGYRTPECEFFGKFTARLDDILNWIPARLAGFFLVISAGLCRYNIRNAFQVMLDQHSRTSSPNAGWSMAAAAGALHVVMEKTGYYRLEGGREQPELQDIGRAMKLVSVAVIISFLFCGGLIVGIGIFF